MEVFDEKFIILIGFYFCSGDNDRISLFNDTRLILCPSV